MLSPNSAIARRRRFSACAGSVQTPDRTSHPAGAGISERPFARPQQRFRHHCEVNVPGLRLRFHTTNCRDPFHSRLPRSVRFRGRYGAQSSPEARFPRQFAALLQSPRHPLPFGLFEPSGSKRSTGLTARSSSRENARWPLAPRRDSFRFQLRINARNSLRPA
jgi:hypothetical protein